MKHSILLASAALLALGGPAIAQDYPAAPATQDPMQQTQPPATEAPAPDAPATPTTPTTPAPTTAAPADTGTTAPTTATEGAAAPATTTDAPATKTTTDDSAAGTTATGATATGTASATVQADWAKYDPANTGSLTPLQFGKWILASRGQDMSAQVDKSVHSKAANLPAVKVLNATSTEFSKADTDKDRKISQAELTAYLSA